MENNAYDYNLTFLSKFVSVMIQFVFFFLYLINETFGSEVHFNVSFFLLFINGHIFISITFRSCGRVVYEGSTVHGNSRWHLTLAFTQQLHPQTSEVIDLFSFHLNTIYLSILSGFYQFLRNFKVIMFTLEKVLNSFSNFSRNKSSVRESVELKHTEQHKNIQNIQKKKCPELHRAATCLFATCKLFSAIHPALVWHTQGGCQAISDAFLRCSRCTQTASIDSLAECVSWDSHASKTTCLQQVTRLVCDVVLTTQTKVASVVALLFLTPWTAKIKCGAFSAGHNPFQSKWRHRVTCFIVLQNILTKKNDTLKNSLSR